MDLALNNQQRLICHKTQTTSQPTENNVNIRLAKAWIAIYR